MAFAAACLFEFYQRRMDLLKWVRWQEGKQNVADVSSTLFKFAAYERLIPLNCLYLPVLRIHSEWSFEASVYKNSWSILVSIKGPSGSISSF